jgi:acetylglutamate kinase
MTVLTPDFDQSEQSTLERIAVYAKKYRGQTIVIKIGGEVIDNPNPTLIDAVIDEAILLKALGANVVLSHGGGKQIDQELKRNHPDLKVVKQDGIRVADMPTLETSRAVANTLTARISALITERGKIYGISGLVGNTTDVISAKQLFDQARTGTLDLNPEYKFLKKHILSMVDMDKLNAYITPDSIPVFGWHCANATDDISDDLTVNADEVGCIIASALGAERLIYFSADTSGEVLGIHHKAPEGSDKKVGDLIPELTISSMQNLIEDGTIEGGMKVKALTCMFALNAGVDGVVICHPSMIIKELMSRDGAGTLITKDATLTPA